MFMGHPQKVLARLNSITDNPTSVGLVTDIEELCVSGLVTLLGRAASAKSIEGLADCMLVSSEPSSVKIVARRVSMAGPAGTQGSICSCIA